VSWESNSPDAFFEIRARRFDSMGAANGGELQVNTVTSGTQSYSTVASDRANAFMVAWQFIGVKARTFGATGPDGPEFQLDAESVGGYRASLGANANGDFVAAWGRFNADGAQGGVLARRFTSTTALLDIDQNGALSPLTDGLLFLRHRFGFTGESLVIGSLAPNCMRCESAAISAYLAADLSAFDIDGDTAIEPLTDGLLVLRYLFGFTGTALTNGAVDTMNCVRCDAAAIVPYIAGLTTLP
jgi:hypothetical protein